MKIVDVSKKTPQKQSTESFIRDDIDEEDNFVSTKETFQTHKLNTSAALEKDIVELSSNLTDRDKDRLKSLWKSKATLHTNHIAELLMQHSALKEAMSDVTDFSQELALGVNLLDDTYINNINNSFLYAISKYIADVFLLDSKTTDRESAIYKHVFSILVSNIKPKTPLVGDKTQMDNIVANMKPTLDPFMSEMFGKTSRSEERRVGKECW